MKSAIFSAILLTALLFGCTTDYYDNYSYIPHSYGNEHVILSGTVLGSDTLLPLDSVGVRIVFENFPYDTLFCLTDSLGEFRCRYDYRNCDAFEVICIPHDTTHAILDTAFTLSGRDLTSGEFNVILVLNTL